MLNLQKSIENLAKESINQSIKDLTKHNHVRNIDKELMKDAKWQDAALKNWLKEPQMSSRCPICQIDIVGPRKLIHLHMKKHLDDKNGGEIKGNEDFTMPFRIHYI